MTLFTKPKCTFCARARRALQKHGHKFKEVIVRDADSRARHAFAMCGGADADKLPMLKVGEDCIYKVVTWAKQNKSST